MEINVKMSTNEFMEFMEWKKDKSVNERLVREVGESLEKLASKVLKALEECGETEAPEYRIRSQADAVLLFEAAADVF